MTNNDITTKRRARAGGQRGFTLLEMIIAVSITAFLVIGTMNLLVNSGRATVRTQAQIFATGDAANTIQNVIGQLREAHSFTLPTSMTAATGETDPNNPELRWITPAGTALSQFSTSLNGETINTAIEIIAPPLLTPATNGYKASATAISVQLTTGASKPLVPIPYNTLGTGTAMALIYRGDPNGDPDPNPTGSTVKDAGSYLWQYTVPPDNSFNIAAYPPVALCKSISAAPNAVQFVRPAYNNLPEQNQVEIKIISGYYSPVNGAQTNEENNGASTSQLTGKCVYMRDHATTGRPSNANTRSSNNAFQYQ